MKIKMSHRKHTLVLLAIATNLFLAVVAAQKPIRLESRIVNGEAAELGEIPFIVSVRESGFHICGGSIIDEQYVLTAAHCLLSTSVGHFSVLPGTIEINTDVDPNPGIEVIDWVEHENYTHSRGYFNDIAILKLAEKLTFNENISPIKLPPKDWFTAGGMSLMVAGWGVLVDLGPTSETLQKVEVKAVTDYECWQRYGDEVHEFYHQCAGNFEQHAHCTGDSGGPLYLKAYPILLGIVSWSHKPCGQHFGIYTKVVNYLDWIESNRHF